MTDLTKRRTDCCGTDRAGEKAMDYFENGYHCAEAVAASVLEELGRESSQAVAHATAFGGGFGRTFDEACGAISGSLIVIGQCYPRECQGDSWDNAARLGAQVRQNFIDAYGTCRCKTLRDRFGEKNQMRECSRIVKRVAADLMVLLQPHEVMNISDSV